MHLLETYPVFDKIPLKRLIKLRNMGDLIAGSAAEISSHSNYDALCTLMFQCDFGDILTFVSSVMKSIFSNKFQHLSLMIYEL
jgi:hypothetical protein